MNRKRIISIILCISVVFSSAFILFASDHVCECDLCIICYEVKLLSSILKLLALALLYISISAPHIVLLFAHQILFRQKHTSYTPITLKVKLTN